MDVDNVNPQGYYFNATVAGNGQTPLPAGILGNMSVNAYPASQVTAISGDGVALTWAQNNCISDVTYSDGKISFKASGAEGNAKVTLTSGGSNVWTWLIWCTDQPAAITIPTKDGSKNYTVLDRNIGAIAASGANDETVFGLYYMFGDPIGYTVDEWESASNGANTYMKTELTSPTIPYCDHQNSSVDKYMWFEPHGTNGRQIGCFLWGAYGDGAQQTWGPYGFDFNKRPGTTSDKLLYDPCPVGYKVMSYDVLDGRTTAADFASANNDAVSLNGTNGTVYFPFNGCVFSGGYTWMTHNYMLYLWTSAYQNGNMAYCYNLHTGFDSTYSGLKTHIMSRGMGVRCMKM